VLDVEAQCNTREAEGCCIGELCRAVIYTARMCKQATNRVTRGAVHSVPFELRCQADTPPELMLSMLDGNLTNKEKVTKRVRCVRVLRS
jgi:hypothetical protein